MNSKFTYVRKEVKEQAINIQKPCRNVKRIKVQSPHKETMIIKTRPILADFERNIIDDDELYEQLVKKRGETLYGRFYNSHKMKNLDLTHWNTSKVKSVANCFDGCINLESVDFSNWNTSSLETMEFCFNDCHQ